MAFQLLARLTNEFTYLIINEVVVCCCGCVEVERKYLSIDDDPRSLFLDLFDWGLT